MEATGQSKNCSDCNCAESRFFPSLVIAKGKRSKRRRIHPLPVQPSMHIVESSARDATSSEVEVEEKEEEDMANCLILLAQGRAFNAGRRLKPHGPKMHACCMCGAAFSSGQALGGHMRRHRPPAATPGGSQSGGLKRRDFSLFDLNLPAPYDDEQEQELGIRAAPAPQSFVFASDRNLVLSSPPSALVDCHY